MISVRTGCSIAILAMAASAQAQPSSTSAAAVASFDRGRALAKAGNFADACVAFEQSEKLEPAFGTLYNLAGCDVHIGKLASAWAAYRELAQRDTNRARRDDAAKQSSALASRLPKLALTATKPDGIAVTPDGIAVTIDGIEVTSVLGTDTPIDLGAHHVEARAPGYKTWQIDVTVSTEGSVLPVAIDLEPAPAEPAPPVRPPPPPPVERVIAAEPSPSGRRTYAVIAAAGGGALIATGLVVGRLASSKWNDVKKLCGDDLVCSDDADLSTGASLLHDARIRANLATGLIAGGVAVVGASVVLWLTAPDAQVRRIGVGVSASPMGLSIAGGF
jgi:hypothetical protein